MLFLWHLALLRPAVAAPPKVESVRPVAVFVCLRLWPIRLYIWIESQVLLFRCQIVPCQCTGLKGISWTFRYRLSGQHTVTHGRGTHSTTHERAQVRLASPVWRAGRMPPGHPHIMRRQEVKKYCVENP